MLSHESRKVAAHHLLRQDGWNCDRQRRQRAFKIIGLRWLVERSFAWLGRNRLFEQGLRVLRQNSKTLIEIASTR